MHVAFLGLGAIGAPMARHLAAPPFSLAVWNRSAARADAFVAVHPGTRRAATPADAARGAAVVVTCLPTSREVEALLDGPDGLLAGLAEGAVLVDCTSGDPAGSRRVAARCAERGVAFLDAPVSGGVVGAEKGALTVMVGGDAATLARVRPVLEAFGQKIVHCGGVGAGDAVKAVNNALLAVHLWSAAEGLAALAKAGIDPAVALDVINTSSGRSNSSMNLFPERVLSRAFPRTFRLALLDKDVGIAADVAREQRTPSPLLQLTAELFRTAHHALGEEADHVEVVRLVERWAGVEIVPPATIAAEDAASILEQPL
ncbi:NAD(P)-dependent oxidoreductase [Roseisolibacter sp. H3M3-2]|uniref:NAD(P)-dependent oxidoreductase n=1 Tax=Roseisolibacter sp. H3M3-2 TaxID=3031323 RepID=UPI0023DAF5E4|nr:NAD(P)-dependent oxidoreductase [Roseisolibacter sp. H3M3-2]MDF1502926.1 NAD(P)-dependent oxidoreductase [Roseisolibacter sp. H3M3-2]